MIRWTIVQFLAISSIFVSWGWGQEIGFIEKFALSEDRLEELKQLVPGTEDYYYFHCLHYQLENDLKKVDEILKPWVKRFGETHRVQLIQNRQALLKFDKDPESTYRYLRDELNLTFAHQREIPSAERNLPHELDESLVSVEAFTEQALRNHRDTRGFTELGYEYIDAGSLHKNKLRHLLQRLTYPDYPKLVDLIIKDLNEKDSPGFGAYSVHRNLTIAQLDECLKLRPKLIDNSKFVNIYLTKLHPSDDINWQADRRIHRRFLNRLHDFASRLNPSFNSLKACIQYRLLDLDRTEGIYDRDQFLNYLKLPRNISYVEPQLIKNTRNRSHIVNLGADYRQQTMLVPIRNDEALVKDYLHRLLVDAANYDVFRPYIRDSFLKQEYATVKILNGKGDKERWASVLSPEQYKSLVRRIDLDFPATNQQFFGSEDIVRIDLFTKNISKLIVKTYQINTFNYYRKFGKEIDTNVNLDGLVPNTETTFNYSEDPVIRKRREFTFEKLNDNGVYIVDFIGGGKSSRALIRRGRLFVVGRNTVAGHIFNAYDSDNQRVGNAKMWIGGNQYDANDKGDILIPYTNQPGNRAAIVSDGKFSSLQTVRQDKEAYALQAGIYVDRESLLFNQQTQVLIRPSLRVAGVPASVNILDDVRLVIRSVDQSGNSATKTFEDLDVKDDQDTVCQFVVPPRLKSISFELSAKAENASTNKEDSLSASRSYSLNGIDVTDEVQDVHLMPTEVGYILEVRGKSGESRPKQGVWAKFTRRGFTDVMALELQTNKDGQVLLGKLDGITRLFVVAAGGKPRIWDIHENSIQRNGKLVSLHGDPIQVAAPRDLQGISRKDVSLYEVRRNQFVSDQFDKLNLVDRFVVIDGLEAGEYALRFKKTGETANISVIAGGTDVGVVLGKHRRAELRDRSPLVIQSVEEQKNSLDIKLGNANQFTRVHVIASRYEPRFDSFSEMARVKDIQPWLKNIAIRRSAYMAGRKLSDEYQYILNRRYEEKFAGNMLDRPSVLVRPWSLRDTRNNVESLASGDDFGRVGNAADKPGERKREADRKNNGLADIANLDFLAKHSVLLANQKPDKDGNLSVPLKELGDLHHIRVIAVDTLSTVQTEVSLNESPLEIRDLRLANALEPDEHFAQSKQIEILQKGNSLTIEDLVSGKYQEFDDLGDVFRLYQSLNPQAGLSQFEFLLNWSELPEEQQRALYSRYSCHELNYFLFKKDKSFFDKVVVPHIGYKAEQGFVDLFLANANLQNYVDSQWQYSKLNIFERILLSQRMEVNSRDIIRSLDDLYWLSPPKRNNLDALYDQSIVSGLLAANQEVFRKSLGTKRALPKLAAFDEADADMESLERAPANSPAPSGGIGGFAGRGRGSTRAGGGGRDFAGKSLEGAVTEDAVMDKRARLEESESEARNKVRSLSEREKMVRRGVEASKSALGLELGRKLKDLDFKSDGADRFYFEQNEALKGVRLQTQALYRRLPPTKEWIEQQYYRLPLDQQTPDRIKTNRFWKDFANHEGGSFLSPYFAEANGSLSEMLLALAVLDLPEKADEHKVEYADNSRTITAGSPMVVMHKQFQEVDFQPRNTAILISENFFQKNDRYRTEDGIRFDKFVNEKFYAHTLYGAQVVVTNPTSTPQGIDLLVQIPRGSVAVSGSQETRSMQLQLAAFSTQTFEYFFYFPTAGEFTHYPAHVSSKDEVLAVADNIEFNVVDQVAEIDKTSWIYVSQNGTPDEVVEFLQTRNLLGVDLAKIAFRMRDKEFFSRVMDTLQNRYIYHHALWSYGIRHKESTYVAEFLKHEQRISSRVGRYFESKLLDVIPYERLWYQHREYAPLVNARVHKVGDSQTILNPAFHGQYHQLMEVLSNKPKLNSEDHLVVTYYLLLQDRISEAIQHFGLVKADDLNERVQFDYCDAYINFYMENPDKAESIANRWKDYPVDLWRNRFKNVLAQVAEIRGAKVSITDKRSDDQQQTKMASETASIDFSIADKTIEISSQALSQATINFYEMDIELMFSRSPFAEKNLDGFSVITPTKTMETKLTGTQTEVEMPEEFSNKNVLVEVRAGDQVKSQAYLANSLTVQTIERFGQLQVSDKDGNPISKAYVKVYSLRGGQPKFHKDGYTDLRGRFNYVSQSNNPLDGITKYSILVMSPELGATTRQVNPPAE